MVVQICFHPYPLSQPPYIPRCSSSFTFRVGASFPLVARMYLTVVLYRPHSPVDIASSRFFPMSFHTFSTMLSNLIPAYLFVTFSHTALLTLADNLFLGMLRKLYCHSSFLMSLFVVSGFNPNATLNAVLPVVFEHPSVSFAAGPCAAFSSFIIFTFPHHTFAYSRFWHNRIRQNRSLDPSIEVRIS